MIKSIFTKSLSIDQQLDCHATVCEVRGSAAGFARLIVGWKRVHVCLSDRWHFREVLSWNMPTKRDRMSATVTWATTTDVFPVYIKEPSVIYTEIWLQSKELQEQKKVHQNYGNNNEYFSSLKLCEKKEQSQVQSRKAFKILQECAAAAQFLWMSFR